MSSLSILTLITTPYPPDVCFFSPERKLQELLEKSYSACFDLAKCNICHRSKSSGRNSSIALNLNILSGITTKLPFLTSNSVLGLFYCLWLRPKQPYCFVVFLGRGAFYERTYLTTFRTEAATTNIADSTKLRSGGLSRHPEEPIMSTRYHLEVKAAS